MSLAKCLWSGTVLLVFSAMPIRTACAQSQTQPSQSVAEAARQNREAENNMVRRSRVISNEDLDLEYFKPRQEGFHLGAAPTLQTGSPKPSTVAAIEAADQAATAATEATVANGKESAENLEIAMLKTQIASVETELNLQQRIAGAETELKLQQREFALDQDTIYSNPLYLTTHAGKPKLDAEQRQIDEKQREIEELKALLVFLEERQEQSHVRRKLLNR